MMFKKSWKAAYKDGFDDGFLACLAYQQLLGNPEVKSAIEHFVEGLMDETKDSRPDLGKGDINGQKEND